MVNIGPNAVIEFSLAYRAGITLLGQQLTVLLPRDTIPVLADIVCVAHVSIIPLKGFNVKSGRFQ